MQRARLWADRGPQREEEVGGPTEELSHAALRRGANRALKLIDAALEGIETDASGLEVVPDGLYW